MHVLFLTDNFPPETNAPATRVYEHARRWVRAGHRVTVITGAPNYPQGKVYPGYKNHWFDSGELDGIQIIRVKTYLAANAGFLKRTLDHLSFGIAGFLGGFIPAPPDIVVATSPQFFAAVGGWSLAAVRRVPFVFELRDLWPASIAAVGALKEGPLLRLLARVEHFLYRRAAAIVPVTHAFKDELVQRGIPATKIHVVTNGVDRERYQPVRRNEDLAGELGVQDRFVVGYLGTHGMAHALENVLDAAEKLRDEERVRFLFVGDGAARAQLLAETERRGLTNVLFEKPRPKSDMPALWSLCDVALVHLKDDPVFASVIPSKLFEAMGTGRPILLASPKGEASSIVEETGAGLHVNAEDPVALAEAVRSLVNDEAALAALQKASARAAERYDRTRLADEMLDVLEQTATGQVKEPLRRLPRTERSRAA